MNKILRTLILSDLFILSSFGLINPILAIFLVQQIPGATVSSVGMTVTIQLLVRAVFQILVGRWADCEQGNCRELYALFFGSILISVVPLGYVISTAMWHIYLVQIAYGLGGALTYPSWRVIFTRYVDGARAGYEWGVYDTVVSLGIAATASVGAFIAEQYSFRILFVIVSVLSFVGTSFLVYIFQQEFTCKIYVRKPKS
jgi:DHA1 family quinolone resistance protein-like MFS transporter